MRSRLRSIAFVVAAMSVAACAAILGIEDRESLLGGDGEGGSEAGAEAGGDGPLDLDGGSDASFTDAPVEGGGGYRCDDGTPVGNCRLCDAGLIGCPATGRCVSECRDQCDSGPIACVSCVGLPAGSYIATCSPDLTPAAASCPASGCACTATAVECPLGNMICDASQCATCGDIETEGVVCKAGTGQMKCKDRTEGDEAKRYRCR